MKTAFTSQQIGKDWRFATVAIIGNAPTLTQELATRENLGLPHHAYAIAVNRALVKAPWADAAVSIDGNWPEGVEFTGLRIVGSDSDALDGVYVNIPHDEVVMSPHETIHIRNNALMAIRIAVEAGATRLMLVGFDAPQYEALHNFPGFMQGLDQLVARVRAKGVDVEFVDPTKTVPAAIGPDSADVYTEGAQP